MTLPDFKGAFMPSMLPAAAGTNIVELDEAGNILRTPIIAWAPDADNPYKAPHPITVEGLARLVDGRAVEHPNGMIHSRDHSVCFGDTTEWRVVAAKGPRAATPTERPTASVANKPKASAEGSPSLKIIWASKPFKQNSFYHYDDGTLDFVFQIDGGENPPKQTGPVSKVTRDVFMSLKKEKDVAEHEDLLEGRAPGLDDIGGYDDDDDDDDDDDLVGGSSDVDVDDDDLI